MSSESLDLVKATEARALWTEALRQPAAELEFKPGMTVMRGWVRETTQLRLTFWFQITQFGFDKRSGGKFIMEFTGQDPRRRASIRERLWRLLDDLSRREVIRINNAVIASLPSPSTEVLSALPEFVRSTYLDGFKTSDRIPSVDTDVWLRYATIADAQQWGDFVASRLPSVVRECERRLNDLPDNTSSMGGVPIENPATNP